MARNYEWRLSVGAALGDDYNDASSVEDWSDDEEALADTKRLSIISNDSDSSSKVTHHGRSTHAPASRQTQHSDKEGSSGEGEREGREGCGRWKGR